MGGWLSAGGALAGVCVWAAIHNKNRNPHSGLQLIYYYPTTPEYLGSRRMPLSLLALFCGEIREGEISSLSLSLSLFFAANIPVAIFFFVVFTFSYSALHLPPPLFLIHCIHKISLKKKENYYCYRYMRFPATPTH